MKFQDVGSDRNFPECEPPFGIGQRLKVCSHNSNGHVGDRGFDVPVDNLALDGASFCRNVLFVLRKGRTRSDKDKNKCRRK